MKDDITLLAKSKIASVEFYVLGNDENSLDSSVTIINNDLFKGNLPMPDGPYDAHMGTTDIKWDCDRCRNEKGVCPGHFGMIKAKYPCKSPLFRDQLLKWLKVICRFCGEPVVDLKTIKSSASKRLNVAAKESKTVTKCPHCKNNHTTVIKSKQEPSVFYRVTYNGKEIVTREEYFNHEIEHTVHRISDNTVKALNHKLQCHPRKFILRNLRISPNTIRPDSRNMGTHHASTSDITLLIKELETINSVLPDEIPPTELITTTLRDLYVLFDSVYFTMIRGNTSANNSVRIVANTNKALTSIASRFPKKVGRLRRNLMGKRVRFMYRSVITGDNALEIDEIGVPEFLAKGVYIPEVVREDNYERLLTYYLNGADKYPGCVSVKKKQSNQTYNINRIKDTYKLQIGDEVNRHLIAGDYIGFNRAPSLLITNIAVHRVVIIKDIYTLCLNVSACSLYNADFDGDAMNAIICQNIGSRNEAKRISGVGTFFNSYQNHSPIIGNFQDSLIGTARFTRDGVNLNKWHAMKMMSQLRGFNKDLRFNKRQYSSREIISRVLPEINLVGKSPKYYRKQYAPYMDYNPKDIKVVIERGELKQGILDKATAGQGANGSIFHIIHNEFGADRAMDAVFSFHQIAGRYFLQTGFTVSIKDIIISLEAQELVKQKTAAMIMKSREITEQLNRQELVSPMGMSIADYYEQSQLEALDPGSKFIIPILRDVDMNKNGMGQLIFTGSKGKDSNFISINAGIGTQTINSKRPARNFSMGRTSPYFARYDMDPISLGFIPQSFREGIDSNVFIFAAGEARHGLISNALSTSITGHQNRVSIKNLESIIVDNMRKCVKGENIIQPLYAECGFDSRKMEKVKFPTVMISDKEFEQNFHTKSKQLAKKYQNAKIQAILDEEFKQLTADRKKYRDIFLNMEKDNPGEYVMSGTQHLPVNVYRIISDAVFNNADIISEMKESEKKLDPIYAITQVRKLCKSLPYTLLNDIQENAESPVPEYMAKSFTLIEILVRSYLSTSWLLKSNITNGLLDIIIRSIKFTLVKALVAYGTAVGILAAQCISEPMTQFVLDSKHRTGGGGGTQTNEIERIKEILGARPTGKMKNTHMLIIPKEEYIYDKIQVQEIANHIEMMTLDRFVSTTHVFFEEYAKPIHPEFKHEIEIIKRSEKYQVKKVPGNISKWCIRFGLDKEEMLLKSMKIETIILSLKSKYRNLYFSYTPENADNLFIRCYLLNNTFKSHAKFSDQLVIDLSYELRDIIIRGLPGVISTTVTNIVRNVVQDDGSLKSTITYGIRTDGTNLEAILQNPYIDPTCTSSDSILEMEYIFGVVCAQQMIVDQIMQTLGMSNRMHASLYASEMTYPGMVTSIQRTGLQKREMDNVTLQLSFQSPVLRLTDAAIHGTIDHISGVSGPLIMGTTPTVGTKYNSVIVDQRMVREMNKNLDSQLEDI